MTEIAVRNHQVPLASLPQAMSPLRIAQISDFHFVRWTRLYDRLRDRLAALDVDLLALTGDFCQHPRDWRRVAGFLRRLVKPLRPRLGAYAVPGNHDAPLLAGEFERGPLRFLVNDSVRIRWNDATITLAGINDSWRSVADLPKALAGCRARELTILLTHMPSTTHHLPDGVVDLVLSGHTHAGQWRIPWIGALMANDRITRAQMHGLHRLGDRWLHVTAGVGASGPFALRLNCPPEIAVLTLVRSSR